MGDKQLQREEDARYRKVDSVIDKMDADASDDDSGDQDRDREKGAQTEGSEE